MLSFLEKYKMMHIAFEYAIDKVKLHNCIFMFQDLFEEYYTDLLKNIS